MTATPTQRLGKYSLLEKIGSGAMGEVWKGRDEVLGRPVAVKTIAGVTAFADDELERLFRREAQAAAGLNHPNIVTVFDFGEDDSRAYLVMELLDGTDLKELIAKRRLGTVRDKLALITKIADAMAYAHRHGFVHRDLKPANIRVLEGGAPKVLDFGLARAREVELTRTGRVGTPHYMSPEQVRGESLDARSDVFALGIVFYEVLTGVRPFPALDLHGVLFQILERRPEPASTREPALGPAFDAVLERALAKDPAERYADAGELAKALAALDPPEGTAVIAPPEIPTAELPTAMVPSRTGSGSGAVAPFRVFFRQEDDGDLEIRSEKRRTLLDLSLEAGIPHYHECGGRGRCSSCRVRVLSGLQNLGPRTAAEEKLAQRLSWTPDVRLACQAQASGEVEVKRLVHDTQDLGLLLRDRRQHQAPEERALAVLTCELLDFEELAAGLPPYDQIHLLNRFFLEIGEAVIAAGGSLQTYTSGGFLALFGLDGKSVRESCRAAARAAVRAAGRMEGFARYAESYYSTPLRLGVGLHFARMIVGQIGHPSKTELLAIGTAGELAAEAARSNGRHQTTVLATEDLVNLVEDDLHLGRVFHDEDLAGSRRTLYEVEDLAKADTTFLVQQSFEKVAARGGELTESFYQILFEMSPQVRELFDGVEMSVQREMLFSTLGAAIRGLDEPDTLMPILAELGRRHVAYGVELHHYDLVEHALLEALRRLLGDELTDDVRLAWTRVYNLIVQGMTDGI